jgi:hypothetical protein
VVNPFEKFLGSVFGCCDVERLLFEYVQGTLDPDVKRRLDDHFRDCPPCIEFLRTYRQTIDVTRRFCCHQVEIPSDVRLKLKEFIRAEF